MSRLAQWLGRERPSVVPWQEDRSTRQFRALMYNPPPPDPTGAPPQPLDPPKRLPRPVARVRRPSVIVAQEAHAGRTVREVRGWTDGPVPPVLTVGPADHHTVHVVITDPTRFDPDVWMQVRACADVTAEVIL